MLHVAVLIQVILVSDHVRSKINGRHRLSEEDVVDVCASYDRAVFEDDDDRGLRLLIRGSLVSGREVRVVLYPVAPEEGVWRLGTAF